MQRGVNVPQAQEVLLRVDMRITICVNQLDLGEYHIHKIANRSAGIVARSFVVSAEM